MKKEFKALPQTRKRCFELGMKEERERILKIIDEWDIEEEIIRTMYDFLSKIRLDYLINSIVKNEIKELKQKIEGEKNESFKT